MIDEKILELYKQSNNFGKLLEMELIVLKQGKVQYTLEIKEKHLATPKAAHGGVVAGLIDGTLGVAALSEVSQRQKIVSTVELKVNFLKPVVLGDQLIAIGEVVSAGNRLIYAEAKVKNQSGTLIASASGTFNVYPADKVF
ncbi:MAG: PaaI family thioesterase [Brumimicrobium sp.]